MSKEARLQHTSSLKGVLSAQPIRLTGRSTASLEADQAAVRALVQAAVNVELFTIPLYMCAMTSIQGTHPMQSENGGSNCSTRSASRLSADRADKILCGTSNRYSAPSDNKCGSFGGCAVPISASQL